MICVGHLLVVPCKYVPNEVILGRNTVTQISILIVTAHQECDEMLIIKPIYTYMYIKEIRDVLDSWVVGEVGGERELVIFLLMIQFRIRILKYFRFSVFIFWIEIFYFFLFIELGFFSLTK